MNFKKVTDIATYSFSHFAHTKQNYDLIPPKIQNNKSQRMVFNSFKVVLEQNSIIKVNVFHKNLKNVEARKK